MPRFTRKESTRSLRREQAGRRRAEDDLAESSRLADEAKQHARRRDKAAYLAAKLADRERSEGTGP